jgi:hypothetical protein
MAGMCAVVCPNSNHDRVGGLSSCVSINEIQASKFWSTVAVPILGAVFGFLVRPNCNSEIDGFGVEREVRRSAPFCVGCTAKTGEVTMTTGNETNTRKIIARLEREGWRKAAGGRHDKFDIPAGPG